MKIYSYKSNPIYKGITSIGAYQRPILPCSIVTLAKLCSVILATLVIITDSFASTSVFNIEANGDSLNQNTEAPHELQGGE